MADGAVSSNFTYTIWHVDSGVEMGIDVLRSVISFHQWSGMLTSIRTSQKAEWTAWLLYAPHRPLFSYLAQSGWKACYSGFAMC